MDTKPYEYSPGRVKYTPRVYSRAELVAQAEEAIAREEKVAEGYEKLAQMAADPALQQILASYAVGYRALPSRIQQGLVTELARLEADQHNETDA